MQSLAYSPVTALRSTWLRASLASVESRGLKDRYLTLLPPDQRERVLGSFADAWIAIDIAIAHYDACERLALPDTDLFEIGHSITSSIHRSYGALALHLVRSSGATPWHVLEEGMPRLWKRIWRGGEIAVVHTGRKDARVDLIGWPLSRFRYCRKTTRGVGQALCEMFSNRVYTHEMPQRRPEVLSYRFAWV